MASTAGTVPFSVSGKSAIVTGAGSGINLCFAVLLLSKGCNVLFADLTLRPEAKKVVDEYSGKDKSKPRAVFLKTDVVDWTQLSAMFEVADREFGDIDLVCPGAGVFEPHWSNFWHPPGASSVSKDDAAGNPGHYATLDINISHPIRTTQLAIAYFLSPTQGTRASPSHPKRIVHTSSTAGQTTSLICPLYFASKHAVSAFVRSLATLEDTRAIRVNAVAPGLIKTPLWTDHPEKMTLIDESQDQWVAPEEVAQAMLDLVEDGDLPGGTILEIGKNSRRVVPQFNNPGPKGSGLNAGGLSVASAEVQGWLDEEEWGRAK
ncbi:hypothetical protein MBLNU459_g5762t1 [Dothideomycetes sp. NU459]